MDNISKKSIEQALNDPEFSFIGSFSDASDTTKVRQEITKLLFRHRETRKLLKIRERERVTLNKNYEKKKRESYIKHSKSSSATEKTKTILVDIDTEQEKYEIDIIDQKIKELSREMTSIKLEIDTLKAISYNLKTEMGGSI